jgi:predicted ribosomally synthesized peptide with SipW-like signal peptide
MTKMKSKKMTKSTFAIIIMAVAMVAMLAFGGTYAFFTATATGKSSSVTTGVIHLKAGDVVTKTDATVVYGDTVLGAITYDLKDTTVNSYVFVTLSADITPNADDTAEAVTFANIFGTALQVKTGWEKLKDLADGAGTVYYYSFTYSDSADTSIEFLDALTVTASPNWDEATAKMPLTMGVGIEVTVSGCAIQQTGFDSVEDAYTEAAKATAHTDL